MTPHKHAELIKAWADGSPIQYRAVPNHGDWKDAPEHLIWDWTAEYRIKPKEEYIKYRDAFPKDYAFHRDYTFQLSPERSEWQCYLFGNRPGGDGISYRPVKGKEPNWFVRLMMLVCFDCLWVKDKE
jgi:hypothetical protein